MSKCQKDVKLSKRCQMSKSQTHRLWRRFTKKINWHNEVQTYWRQFWRHIWWSPKLFKNTFYAHFEGFWWPSYVTSKLTSICVNLIMSIYFFFVNLLHSLCVWLFDIWQHGWGQDRGARQGGETGGETRGETREQNKGRNRERNEPPGETFTTWYFYHTNNLTTQRMSERVLKLSCHWYKV